ncbi:MAG: hypothetical protein HYV09_24300 [Deltaproteobacteria bacterium]|nr:hypothetical protein [Deltaproteobacteria bacterium]
MLGGLRRKNLHTWLGGWLRSLADRRSAAPGPRHLLFALCDHWEPLWGYASREVADARVRFWREEYPRMAERHRDADGRPPRHTFFFPGEQVDDRWLATLAELAAAGYGEVELHLHHDGDTAEGLRADLARYVELLARHGHLSRGVDGRPRYGFIHGNWCLANARRDGRYCGVDAELPLLFETGCYADFTFPSAPDECQPNVVNRIWWPAGDLARRRAYERAEHARVGRRHDDRLLMISGPLALARRPGALSVRIESSAITANDPATPARVATWVSQAIHVEGRPEWVFVKVHTHGAPEAQARSLLGEGGRALHDALRGFDDRARWSLHYVTAREMYNVAMAAMDGCRGDPAAHFDHVLPPPPVVAHGSAR